MSTPRFVLVLALFVAGCSGSSGDGLPIPEQPMEVPGIENPSAIDFYNHGEELLERRPGAAAEAFYWASRRDPTWASPLFARRLALFLGDHLLYAGYLSRDRRVMRRPVVAQLDSLYLRALTLNPFLDRRLESRAIMTYWKESVRRAYRRAYPMQNLSDAQLAILLQQALWDAGDPLKARLAHSEGRYADAVTYYRNAIEKASQPAELHADMARALFMLGRHEEAVDHMGHAIAELRERDEDELQRLYSSKALYFQTVGLIHEQRDDTAAARRAYADALQEDLAYYPAHIRLAELAADAGDTLTALNELHLAAEIGPDEPVVLLSYGRLLEATDDVAGAEAAYRHLVQVEPYFAAGFARLAHVLDVQDRPVDAATAYRDFVRLAPRDAGELTDARRRLEQLVRSVPELREAADSAGVPGGGP
ncbi:MAG: tetratricopeptide repeat protein [Gemmatimonadota bacterium]